MNSQPAFPGLCSIIVELFYAWQPFWVDITESRLYTANKYRLRYVGVIYRLRHGCGRNGVSQAIVVKLRYGGYDLTEYGSV